MYGFLWLSFFQHPLICLSVSQVKPEQRPSLDEILNHPFLRNGGPRQRFSTAHGLRGSSSSSTTDPAAAMRSASSKVISGTACAVNGGSASSAGRVGQKLTPERYGAGGAMGRPPLKTRSSNVDAEGGEVAQQENVRAVKPRVGVTGPIGERSVEVRLKGDVSSAAWCYEPRELCLSSFLLQFFLDSFLVTAIMYVVSCCIC